MESEQKKLNDLLDFLKDILSERLTDSIRIQVGKAMSEVIQEEREKKVSPALLALEPHLLRYQQWAHHNPCGSTELKNVQNKIIELYKPLE